MYSLNISPQVDHLANRINHCNTWLSRGALPDACYGYKLSFQEDWTKVAMYGNNYKWINLLNENNNELLLQERLRYGDEWYDAQLPEYVGALRSLIIPGITSLTDAVNNRIKGLPQKYINDWLSGTLVSALRCAMLSDNFDCLGCHLPIIYFSGYVPYDIVDNAIIVS